MPVIRYNIPVGTTTSYIEHSPDFRDSEISETRFGDVVIDITGDYHNSKLGWSSENSIDEDENGFYISGGSSLIKEDDKILGSKVSIYMPNINKDGLEINFGNNKSDKIFGVLKRVNGKISLHSSYTNEKNPFGGDININTAMENLSSNESEEYISVPLLNPLEYGRINQLKSEIPYSDYDSSSLNYEDYIASKGITLQDFLDKCEYIRYNESYVNEFGVSNFIVSFYAKYFPIYDKVTLIIEYKDGTYEMYKGKLSVSKEDGIVVADTFDMGLGNDISGFYLFYGIVPSVIFQENLRYNKKEIINPSLNLNLFEIGSTDVYSSPRITNQYITFSIGRETQYAETTVFMPSSVSKWFVETNSPISINGNNLKSGDKLVFDARNPLTTLTFSSTSNILDMLEPVIFNKFENRFYMKNWIEGKLASIYGLFKDGEELRLSHIMFSRKMKPNKIQIAYGYGTGHYSGGGFSTGQVGIAADSGSELFYVDNGGDDTYQDTGTVAMTINPRVDGNTFHLTSATLKDNIEVYEILGESAKNEFSNWSFTIPDKITIDREHMRSGATYQIVYTPIINPLMTTLYIHDGKFKSENLNKVSKYSSFVGLYGLYNKRATIRIGKLLEDGTAIYFKQVISVDSILSKDMLIGITSKFKNIVL